jgi:predicted esterase
MPLVVFLHGAGSTAIRTLPLLQSGADRLRCAVFAPQSADYTWDLIVGGFGPDVEALDALLPMVCEQVPVDPEKVGLAGFSDGASYALSLGLRNGTLFRSVVAFSPGFRIPGNRNGKPPVFLSHGRADTVLPIDRCSRRIVPALQRAGYDVDYREFDGGHEVPEDIAALGLALVTRRGSTTGAESPEQGRGADT